MSRSRLTLRELKVPWPTPTADGLALACPLCGLSERRFAGDHTARRQKLDRHIARPHARCRACQTIVASSRMPYHRQRWHAYPTPPIPGLESVA